jgi:tetratricopeptide (TPR) repeat protein
MAYCQSQLYIEYMRERYGPRTIGEMLAAYSAGLDSGPAIAKVCRVDKAEFEKGYREYLDKVVRSLGPARAAGKPMTLSALQQAHEDKPEDIETAAKLAEQYLLRRDKKEARKLAEQVLAKEPHHQLASYVKARLLMDAGDEDGAKTLLEEALDKNNPDVKVLQALGKMYFEAKNFAKAAEMYERGRQVEPYENKWLVELVRVRRQLDDQAGLVDLLKKIVASDPDELEERKRLTKILLEAKRYAEAERYAREALEIDVRDREARESLEKSLTAQNKTAELKEFRALFTK